MSKVIRTADSQNEDIRFIGFSEKLILFINTKLSVMYIKATGVFRQYS